MLKIAWQIGVWFHRTFKDAQFKSGPFIPPRAPKDESDELRAELAALSKTLADHQVEHHERAQQLEALAEQLRTAKDEQAFWEQMAVEVEAEKSNLNARLATKQAQTAIQPAGTVAALVNAASSAAAQVHLDEAETRRIIDSQLRQAGWMVDTDELRYSKAPAPKREKTWQSPSGRRPAVRRITSFLSV